MPFPRRTARAVASLPYWTLLAEEPYEKRDKKASQNLYNMKKKTKQHGNKEAVKQNARRASGVAVLREPEGYSTSSESYEGQPVCQLHSTEVTFLC